MKKYSQNNEDLIISNYFGDFKGNLLSVGENDGKTLSNSLRLIENGWSAVLFEPSEEAFSRLQTLHKDNAKVLCLKYGLAGQTGTFEFYESGSHLKNGDISLLSTLVEAETEKWEDVGEEFTKKSIDCLSFDDALTEIRKNDSNLPFDFITLDAEGVDVVILKQIDLSNVSALCIEFNQDETVKAEIMEYCAKFGMNTIIYQSYENLVIAKSETFKVVSKDTNVFNELKLTTMEENELYSWEDFTVKGYCETKSKILKLINSSDVEYPINWNLVDTNMDFFKIIKAMNPSFTKEAAEKAGISQFLKQ